MKITHSIHIDAPPRRVWDLTADVLSSAEWIPTVTSVRALSDGPIGPGQRYAVKQPMQEEKTWTVTRFEPDALFAWESHLGGKPMTAEHRIAADGAGTRNTLVLDIEGAGGVTGWLNRWVILGALAAENRSFKRRAEAMAP